MAHLHQARGRRARGEDDIQELESTCEAMIHLARVVVPMESSTAKLYTSAS